MRASLPVVLAAGSKTCDSTRQRPFHLEGRDLTFEVTKRINLLLTYALDSRKMMYLRQAGGGGIRTESLNLSVVLLAIGVAFVSDASAAAIMMGFSIPGLLLCSRQKDYALHL